MEKVQRRLCTPFLVFLLLIAASLVVLCRGVDLTIVGYEGVLYFGEDNPRNPEKVISFLNQLPGDHIHIVTNGSVKDRRDSISRTLCGKPGMLQETNEGDVQTAGISISVTTEDITPQWIDKMIKLRCPDRLTLAKADGRNKTISVMSAKDISSASKQSVSDLYDTAEHNKRVVFLLLMIQSILQRPSEKSLKVYTVGEKSADLVSGSGTLSDAIFNYDSEETGRWNGENSVHSIDDRPSTWSTEEKEFGKLFDVLPNKVRNVDLRTFSLHLKAKQNPSPSAGNLKKLMKDLSYYARKWKESPKIKESLQQLVLDIQGNIISAPVPETKADN